MKKHRNETTQATFTKFGGVDEYTCLTCGHHGQFAFVDLEPIRCANCGRLLVVELPSKSFEPSEFQQWLENGAGLSEDEVKALQGNQGYYNLVKRAYFAKDVEAEVEAAYVQKKLDEDAEIDEAWERVADERRKERE